MEVHRGAGTMCNTKTSKVISRTDPMIQRKETRVPLRDNKKVDKIDDDNYWESINHYSFMDICNSILWQWNCSRMLDIAILTSFCL